MKILKYLLGLIVLLALIFFGRGLMTPSVSYESTIEVNKSAKESWAVMSDEVNLPKWIEGFKRAELVSGQANTVGAVSNIYVDQNGQEMVMKETVKAVKDHELLAMTFSMDFMDMDYEMIFDESNGKTKITSKSTTKGNGLFAKSMISFMKGSMKGQEDKNMMSLKKLVDENTKNYFEGYIIEEKENSVNLSSQ